jgi:diguanylate cyclase (GGDEF)-like protein/putative nucleotidyltransferase with HDIG domain
MSPNDLGRAARFYIFSVVTAGVLAVIDSVVVLTANVVPWQWAMLAVLTLLSGSFTVRIPGIPARLSVSETFVFAAVLLFGPAAATMIVVLDTLVISFWLGRRSTQSSQPSRLLFNIAAPAVAIWVASHTFYFLTGISPLSVKPQPVLSIALPLLGLATLYFLLNSWLIAFAVGFQKHTSAFTIWKQNFLWLCLNYFSGASVAALLLPYLLQANTYDSFLYVSGVLLPVLVIFYLTYKAALGRVEDANKHLSQLNKLYLSTIETLAMAIDAKDQITHGHIRRVQQYAVGLARHIGVKDEAQISAIEAASLLHDMGKLAVPEYILNKPGKLTPAEFEKMKLHASVGADILSAIDFPYPVVPIVRHHHESWDGGGYPDGLKGTDIPIGARILAVVDCFDALTSDRPYRPKLADSEAIKILNDRRGSMYDPLVVDAFVSVHSQIAPQSTGDPASVGEVLSAISKKSASAERPVFNARFEEIAASTEEMLVLYDLAKSLTGNIAVGDLGDVIAKHLRRIVPASTCVFFLYDVERDELWSAHAAGENSSHFSGLRIPRGERLSGWVAANKQTILNSDPVLDLGEMARTMKPRLNSCLSTPLMAGDQLVGVLTLYSPTIDAFSEDHRRIIEVVARQVSGTVRHAVDFERYRTTHFRDRLTGLPNLHHLQELVASQLSSMSGVSLVLVTLRSHNRISKLFGLSTADRSLEVVAAALRRGLRGGDLLFRYGSDEFLVLLTQTDAEAAQFVAARIARQIVDAVPPSEVDGSSWELTIGLSAAPVDGMSVESLVETARTRERRIGDGPQASYIH